MNMQVKAVQVTTEVIEGTTAVMLKNNLNTFLASLGSATILGIEYQAVVDSTDSKQFSALVAYMK